MGFVAYFLWVATLALLAAFAVSAMLGTQVSMLMAVTVGFLHLGASGLLIAVAILESK